MTDLGAWDYVAVFTGTIVLTLVLTPLALGAAMRWGLFDWPGGHKGHVSPVPYLGGAAIAVSFAAVVMGAALVRPPQAGLGTLALILGLAVALSLLGLADDLWGLSRWLRVAVEVVGALALWHGDAGASLFRSPALNAAATVLWVVTVTNAFNLLDNMDGLTAGVAGIAALVFFAIGALNGQFLVATLSIALAGCAAGFLRTNFHPARLYLGDGGSLFLGFLLSVIGLKLRFEGPTQVTFFVPVLVLGVALFDTALVVCNRLVHRRNPLSGGRDHTSHRLVLLGIPVPFAVTLIYGGAISLGWLGFVMANVPRSTGYLLMGWVLATASFIGALLSAVPVYETSKRRQLVLQEVARAGPEPPAVAGVVEPGTV